LSLIVLLFVRLLVGRLDRLLAQLPQVGELLLVGLRKLLTHRARDSMREATRPRWSWPEPAVQPGRRPPAGRARCRRRGEALRRPPAGARAASRRRAPARPGSCRRRRQRERSATRSGAPRRPGRPA